MENVSKFQVLGKMTKGFTEVDSVTVLKAVSSIQAKGTIMVKDAKIRIRWMMPWVTRF